MTVNSLFMAILALASSPGAAKQTGYSAEQMAVFRTIGKVASETCTAPPTAGFTVHANASAGVSLAPDKLIAKLISYGVRLSGGGSYDRWKGPLQRDIGAALAARSNCQEAVFKAMVSKLPLANPSNGHVIPTPRQPAIIYKKIQTSAKPSSPPAISVTGNTSGPQINATGPSTNQAIGGPVANGSGSANQYFFGIPVTADQKQQAHDALLARLRELANYPELGKVEPSDSIAINLFHFKAPRSLYFLLANFDRDTIASIPNGEALNRYKKEYYDLEYISREFERNAVTHIGKLVATRFPADWVAYYSYALQRAAGRSSEQILAEQGQLNPGMTPQEADRIYQVLLSDPVYGQVLKLTGQTYTDVTQQSHDLLKPFAY